MFDPARFSAVTTTSSSTDVRDASCASAVAPPPKANTLLIAHDSSVRCFDFNMCNPHSGRATISPNIFVCRIDDRSAVTFDGKNSGAEQQYTELSRTMESRSLQRNPERSTGAGRRPGPARVSIGVAKKKHLPSLGMGRRQVGAHPQDGGFSPQISAQPARWPIARWHNCPLRAYRATRSVKAEILGAAEPRDRATESAGTVQARARASSAAAPVVRVGDGARSRSTSARTTTSGWPNHPALRRGGAARRSTATATAWRRCASSAARRTSTRSSKRG